MTGRSGSSRILTIQTDEREMVPLFRKNHKMIDEKLIQTDKRYSQLKQKPREENNRGDEMLEMLVLPGLFCICQVEDYSQVNLDADYCFIGKTDEEKSLVCHTEDVPDNTIQRSDGWRAFRIQGVLDFSLIGILAKISGALARQKIGLFAISTFNTDYVLVKDKDYKRAVEALTSEGYLI